MVEPFKFYDYKERGQVLSTIRARNLQDADDQFTKQTGRDPSLLGLHIRQDPEELAKLKQPR